MACKTQQSVGRGLNYTKEETHANLMESYEHRQRLEEFSEIRQSMPGSPVYHRRC